MVTYDEVINQSDLIIQRYTPVSIKVDRYRPTSQLRNTKQCMVQSDEQCLRKTRLVFDLPSKQPDLHGHKHNGLLVQSSDATHIDQRLESRHLYTSTEAGRQFYMETATRSVLKRGAYGH